ncbi:MAG: aminomethyl-transferring glycine dehydrogenase, partial [Limisphaerales bacterium]
MLVTETVNDNSEVKRLEKSEPAGPKPAAVAQSHPAAEFPRRHIGPSEAEAQAMLKSLGYSSLSALIDEAVPRSIRLEAPLRLPEARSEHEVLEALRAIASQNQVFRSCIGMGYSDCITPPVIHRGILENPGWYTQYTPYQAEISQGRLEALLNFQTMVIDLTGMEVANASLLDEATAAAEAMIMCHGMKPERCVFFVSAGCHPQTIEVVRTRANALGIEVVVAVPEQFEFTDKVCGALVQYPDTYGEIHDYTEFVERARAAGALVAVAADLLSLALLRSPGEFGADIALGSAQRFGVPLGYGGPHAAFFATRDAFKRHMPGRIVGVSRDSRGRSALRLSLQTREQHIRREKATSNICTAQALLANIAAMYACYHGPAGLKAIAQRVHRLTVALARGLERLGCRTTSNPFFDTIQVRPAKRSAGDVLRRAEARKINLRPISEQTLGVSLDETTSEKDVMELLEVFNGDSPCDMTVAALAGEGSLDYPEEFGRHSEYLSHPVFNRYHSETEMLRYLKRLEFRDLSLTTSMIPLGSCTMKLNAAAEMFPVSWPEVGGLHPFAPAAQARGYR